MLIIDSHNHVGYCSLDHQGVDEMNRFGIDLCWLLTWIHPRPEHPGSTFGWDPRNAREDGTHRAATLQHVIAARDRFPQRFIPGYCPDPRLPDAPGLLKAAVDIHRVRVCGEWSYRMPLDDPRTINLFQTAGELNTPVILHLDVPDLPDKQNPTGPRIPQQQWFGGGADTLARTLTACPHTTIVGHCPGFWRYISASESTDHDIYPRGPITPTGRLFQLLDNHPNLMADLSAGSGLNALKRFDDAGRQFLIDYADRLMFGRDMAGDALRQHLLSLNLPDNVQRKIFHENALRLVPLTDTQYPALSP